MASSRKARRVAAGTRRMFCASVLVSTRKPSAVDPVPGVVSAIVSEHESRDHARPMHGFARSARRRYGAADSQPDPGDLYLRYCAGAWGLLAGFVSYLVNRVISLPPTSGCKSDSSASASGLA